MAESIFWIATILLVYNYLLYPLFLRLIVAGRSQNSQVFLTDNELPKLSILIPAFNEERVIHSKIESIYQSQYPIDNYEVIIGSDNSTDRTNEIIQELQEEYRNLKLHVFEHRTGKPGIINKLVEEAQGDILVLTDADVELNNDCLFQMLKHFKNPDIGLVDTNMMSRSSYNDGISYQESTYVRFEVKIKHWEGIAWGSMMGPFGGCYALRKDYYTPVPDNYVVDDFFIAMNVLIKGKKCINELEAKCYEQTSVQIQEEFRRKIRISAGNFQNLGTFVNLLFKPFSAIGFTFLSHKVLRWFGPFFIMLAYFSSMWLFLSLDEYIFFFFLQNLLIIMALIDASLQKIGVHSVILRFITHFYSMNLALLLGFFKYLGGIKTNVWQPTQRE